MLSTSSAYRLFPTSSRQRLLTLVTSFPSDSNHSTLSLISGNGDDFAYFHHKSSVSPQVSTLLIVLALVVLISTIISSPHSIQLPKRLQMYLSRWIPSPKEQLLDRLPTPPVVHIPREIQLSAAGHAAYNQALDKYGDVVIIPRHGKKEYIVDHCHVQNVLTDSKNYSFEKAVTNMLYMQFMLWFKKGTFVQELDKLVQDGVTPRLDSVMEMISPIFNRESNKLLDQTRDDNIVEIDDMYQWAHHAIAQAMVILIIGEQYLTPTMTQYFMDVVTAITHLSGIYSNTQAWKYFPSLWSAKTTIQAIFGTIIPRFFFGVLPKLWKMNSKNVFFDYSVDVDDDKVNEHCAFFDILVAKHRNKRTGKLSFFNFIWCSTICMGIIFASVHQTAVVAVWCIMNLCYRQDEYLNEIRTEMTEYIQSDDQGDYHLSISSLRNLTKMDSFIREVMRTKGDTFAPVRYTLQDVQVGKYKIPKNSLCAPLVKRCHEHVDNYGADGVQFNGFQWYHQNKPAVQGSHDFISFGLGRWACPGRHLAIAEIKIILITLFDKFDLQLKNGTFSTPDPMNATSVAPEGIVLITKRSRAE